MVNRFACAASGVIEEYFSSRARHFSWGLSNQGFYTSWRKLPQEAPRNACDAVQRFLSRNYQRRQQLHRETTYLQLIERGYWCLLCLLLILMLVNGFLGLRPALLVSFEPYDNGIQWSRIHLKMDYKKVYQNFWRTLYVCPPAPWLGGGCPSCPPSLPPPLLTAQ